MYKYVLPIIACAWLCGCQYAGKPAQTKREANSYLQIYRGTVSQTFIAEENNLNGIALLLEGNIPTLEIILRSSGRIVYRHNFRNYHSTVRKTDYFKLPVQENSAGKEYLFELNIDSPEATCFIAYHRGDPYPAGKLRFKEDIKNGDLFFKTIYRKTPGAILKPVAAAILRDRAFIFFYTCTGALLIGGFMFVYIKEKKQRQSRQNRPHDS